MKNLLFNNLLTLTVILFVSCSYNNQIKSETASNDTVILTVKDTTPVVKADSLQAIVAKGDTVAAQSTRVESTERGTTSPHPGAVSNPGANQSQTDSIKAAKTKGKKKN